MIVNDIESQLLTDNNDKKMEIYTSYLKFFLNLIIFFSSVSAIFVLVYYIAKLVL